MTKEEIIDMARQSGFDPHDMSSDFTCNLDDIEAFAKLVAEHERERILGIVKEGLWDGVGLRQHLEQGENKND